MCRLPKLSAYSNQLGAVVPATKTATRGGDTTAQIAPAITINE
ncbi:hypothetical protein EDB38_1167 [Vibrio crassostreae]|nr:hypothetical protein EDB58_11534 [Vibrio crassostreae]TCL22145.1 hypothetical protein EDB52_11145 [Vibrio crassostreae]TCN04904.1 hypothetical protein EDB35_12056 [Vibrio crassostreae]TCN97839.1 hypothetical protein EDB30_11518 [Vibrio crassostreae]TCT44849.1 hypothetical protein EDB39_12330 [Vibrio crassostreae]